MPRLSRQDIGKSGGLLSPSKTKMSAQKPVAAASSQAKKNVDYLRLRDLYDPDNRYSGLAQLGDTKVDSPDVRNEHGVEVLNVGEYMTKLQDGDVVEVEVILKLWNIRLPKDALPNSRDANGSRAYQLILRHTQLLPCAAYTKKSLHNSKGKRKATDELEGQSPAKNSKICDIFDIEMETDDE
ncbi:hypothetical protein EV702DRAFT_18839 [Suillus placidus]|uniref:Uncharacterized protein n=1 Tax=Suillus placidus TaxID=48579 RepID=A0A9P7A7J4_9AGAM|nr:hypothetical protein EV702DRAFT_18839 [Suillus placidus]